SLLDMIDHVPLCTLDDIERFKDMCQHAIDHGELEGLKKFPHISSRELKKKQAAANQEAKEAAKVKKNSKGKAKEDAGLGALVAAMQQNAKDRSDALIDKLEAQAKADNATKGRKRKGAAKDLAAENEPTEEEFQALQSKLFSKKPKA
ncbi:hypothetical protein HDU91_003173, partial [Kappamyces sp. JEL0680]